MYSSRPSSKTKGAPHNQRKAAEVPFVELSVDAGVRLPVA
jgi:hypothetical protein